MNIWIYRPDKKKPIDLDYVFNQKGISYTKIKEAKKTAKEIVLLQPPPRQKHQVEVPY